MYHPLGQWVDPASARGHQRPLGPRQRVLPQPDHSAVVEPVAQPLGAVTIIGPGAGLALAGQGVLRDLVVTAEGR